MKQTMARRIAWGIGVGVVVLAGLLTEAANAAPLLLEEPTTWFKLDPTVGRDWEVVDVPGDVAAVLLRRRGSRPGSVVRHILSLQSRASSAYDVAVSEVARVMEQKHIPIEILVVNYADRQDLAKSAVHQAEEKGFDLILSTGSDTTAWLWANYRGGRLPVVSVCSKDPVALGQVQRYDAGTGTNFALTSLNPPIDVQMAYAVEVMPEILNLAVIVDSRNKSAVETQAIPISALARARGIRVLNLSLTGGTGATSASDEEIAEELNGLVSKAIESMQRNDINLTKSMFLITGSTAVFEQLETINAHASHVPVVSMVPDTVRAGPSSAVLSIGVSFRSNAVQAALYAASILDGREKPGDLKIGVVTPPDIAINFRRAREIGLRIPFTFFESANVIYDNDDVKVRSDDTGAK